MPQILKPMQPPAVGFLKGCVPSQKGLLHRSKVAPSLSGPVGFMLSIEDEIQQLKKQHDALILAHFYEEGDIQDLADEIGDSYFLAQRGQQSQAKVILL